MDNSLLHGLPSNDVNLTQDNSSGFGLLPPIVDSDLQNLINNITLGIAVFGIIANLSYLYVIAKIPRMRTVTNVYLLNLSVADILFLIAMTTYNILILYLMIEVKNPTAACIAVNAILVLPMNASVFTIALVATDRYIAVCHPMKAKRMNTKKQAIWIIILTWLIAPVFSIPSSLVCVIPDSTTLVIVALILQMGPFMLSMLTVIILYMLIVRQMHKRETNTTTKNLELIAKREKRQVITVLIIATFIFFGCVLPFQIKTFFELLIIFGKPMPISFQNYQTLITITIMLLFLNSAINPIIYKTFSSKYRLAFLEAFFCYKCIGSVPKPRRGSLSHSSTYSTERLAGHRIKITNGKMKNGTWL
ncbi:neuromedin-U receptor 2-like [Saccoglossus kowalevskii]|uniref:Neuromedin-U receptor 2-like n=1 Tax=Saccoglossus kowalevskii TaxID=10224 RepID=A0ABM0MQD8_SACKO|nr:PREDICTED: neuromedin-U receptor 2-like [Saccoglossus kowalevskii]